MSSMISHNYFLTIAIPTFNRIESLEATLFNLISEIKLLKSRRAIEIEILVCDNASTDQTEDFCKNLALKYSFLRYHRNEKNIGMMRNLHVAGKLSHGRFFWPFGDDDFLYPTCLERLISFIQKQDLDSVGLISLGYEDICINQEQPTVQRKFNLESGHYFRENPITATFSALRLLFISATIYSREEFLKKDVFSESHPAELATHLKIIYRICAEKSQLHFRLPVVIGSRVNPNKWGGMWAVMIGYEFKVILKTLSEQRVDRKVLSQFVSLSGYIQSYFRLSLLREDYGFFYQSARELIDHRRSWHLCQFLIDRILDLEFLRSSLLRMAKRADQSFEEKRSRIASYVTRFENPNS